jgi:hypothetical protein
MNSSQATGKEGSESPFLQELDAGIEVPAHDEDAAQAAGAAGATRQAPDEFAAKCARFESEISGLQDGLDKMDTALLRLGRRITRAAMGLVLALAALGALAVLQMRHGGGRLAGKAEPEAGTNVSANLLSELSDLRAQIGRVRAESSVGPNPGSGPVPRGAQVSFAHWDQGQQPVRLIKRDEGVCFLTGVSGHFQGAGENVRVWIAEDGYWYLGGQSMQEGISADCVVLRY